MSPSSSLLAQPSLSRMARCFGATTLVALLLSSAGARAETWVQIGPTLETSMTVPADAHLALDLPVGEVEVVGTDGDTLRARMEIECKSTKGRCAKRAERAAFTTQQSDQQLTLAVTPQGMNKYKGSQVRITIEVPRTQTLAIEFGAGELQVRDVDACVSVRMFAGDADLHLASERIDEISLKTGMGESSLYVDADAVEGRRPLLVGSKVTHTLGNGDCSLAARLRFGELTAHLR